MGSLAILGPLWKQPWHQFLNYISHSQRLRHQSKAPRYLRWLGWDNETPCGSFLSQRLDVSTRFQSLGFTNWDYILIALCPYAMGGDWALDSKVDPFASRAIPAKTGYKRYYPSCRKHLKLSRWYGTGHGWPAWRRGMARGGMNPFLRCPDTISPLKPQHDTVHLSVEPV